MTLIKQEEAECQKHKVQKLTGVWSAAVSKNLVPPGSSWPSLLPRSCQLYLGKDAPHWPYRLEWFGPTSQRSEDSLLMQMEFQNPQFMGVSEKPPERLSRLFTFDPGKAKVLDRTQQITDFLAFQVQNPPKFPGKASNPSGTSGPP